MAEKDKHIKELEIEVLSANQKLAAGADTDSEDDTDLMLQASGKNVLGLTLRQSGQVFIWIFIHLTSHTG